MKLNRCKMSSLPLEALLVRSPVRLLLPIHQMRENDSSLSRIRVTGRFSRNVASRLVRWQLLTGLGRRKDGDELRLSASPIISPPNKLSHSMTALRKKIWPARRGVSVASRVGSQSQGINTNTIAVYRAAFAVRDHSVPVRITHGNCL